MNHKKKYIWTFWTKPWRDRDRELFELALLGLSVSLAKSHGKALGVYSDSYGAGLIRRARIPVDVSADLDDMPPEITGAKWAAPKMFVLGQKLAEPAAHIDYDVFLWKPQINHPEADLVVQNPETSPWYTSFYQSTYTKFIRATRTNPPVLSKYALRGEYAGYNCGYLDVVRLDKVRNWAKKSFALFLKTPNFQSEFNVIPEQYLLYALAKDDPEFIIESLLKDPDRNWSPQFEAMGYTHLMVAKTRKRAEILQKTLKHLQARERKVYDAILHHFAEKKKLPSLSTMAKTLVKGVLDEAVATARGTAPVAVTTWEERLEICRACEFFIPSTTRCSKCGCFMKVKTRMRTARCPVGKWGPVTATNEDTIVWKT